MKWYLFLFSVILVFGANSIGLAQAPYEQQADSLLKVIAQSNEDTVKAKNYRTLTRIFAYNDLERAKKYANAAIDHSQKAGDMKGVADGLSNMFNVHLFAGVPTDSLRADLEKLENHVRKMGDSVAMQKVYQKYALYYGRIGQVDKELAYELKSLDLARKYVKNPELEAISLFNIGVSLNNMEQIEKAREHFYDFLALDIDNEHFEAKTNFQLGAIHFKFNQLDSSKIYFDKALHFFERDNYLQEIIKVKIWMGRIYDELEQFAKAEQNHQAAYQLAKENDIKILLQETYAGFFTHNYAKKNFQLAVEFGQRYLEEMAQNQNYFVQPEYLEKLHDSYAKLGQYKIAYEIRDNLAALKDSVKTADHLQQVLELETKFQVQEQKNKNQLLAAENSIARSKLQNAQVVAIALLLALLLAGGWGYSAFNAKQREKRYSKELETTVKERTMELHVTNKNLQQANYELRMFNYIASHDIKEPIRVVSSYVNLIHKRLPKEISEKLEEYFKYIKNSTSQLYTLIEDFARYTSLSKNEKIKPQSVDLQLLTKSVTQALEKKIEKYDGQVITKELPIIQSNNSLLFSALKNLIDNGLKYNDSTSPIVEVTYNSMGSHHEILVTDNGVGIEKKYQDNAFEMFERLNNKGRFDREGSGIGLAIVKLIMEKLDGDITIKSEVNKGSTFILSLPRE